jgi:hypothetical protein
LKKTEKYLNRHPELLARKCSQAFSVRDSVITHDSVSYDTVNVDNDFVYKIDTVYISGEPVVLKSKCPQSKVITKTVYRDTTVFQRDRYTEYLLQRQVASLATDTSKLNSKIIAFKLKVSKQISIIWKLIIVVVILSLWALRKPLIALVKTFILHIPPIS